MEKKTILVSACLLGCNCRHNGGDALDPQVLSVALASHAVPVCPEQLGGLPTPRPSAEITGGSGDDVLDGQARAITRDHQDVTSELAHGAREAVKIAKLLGVTEAILKDRSPSCGVTEIYNGSFTGKTRPGKGVTAALLEQYGIKLISSDSFEEYEEED